MANYIKGNVKFTPVVEQINRKWAPVKHTCSSARTLGPVKTESQSWMGSGTRTTFRAGLGSMAKNYFVFRANARVTDPTSNEMLQRASFTAGNAWYLAARADLMAINHNQQVYQTLVNNPSAYLPINGGARFYAAGYSFIGLMRAWAIKEHAAGGTLPASHELPDAVTA